MIERSLVKNFDKLTSNDFTIIFKSFGKAKLASKQLQKYFNIFIDKNVNSFSYFECVDILINYPRVINNIEIFSLDMFLKLHSLINQGIDKLQINRTVNLYFVLYGTEDERIRKSIPYDNRFSTLITEKQSNLTSKHIYLLFLAHHFSKIALPTELVSIINNYTLKNFDSFLPEELNNIISLINQDGNNTLFKDILIRDINKLYLEKIKESVTLMDCKEKISCLYTILPIQGNLNLT